MIGRSLELPHPPRLHTSRQLRRIKPPLTRDPHGRQAAAAGLIPQRGFVEAKQIADPGDRE
jgi:hypothetical protein